MAPGRAGRMRTTYVDMLQPRLHRLSARAVNSIRIITGNGTEAEGQPLAV